MSVLRTVLGDPFKQSFCFFWRIFHIVQVCYKRISLFQVSIIIANLFVSQGRDKQKKNAVLIMY